MGKGAETRGTILETALAVASRDGLGGLSIGGLAREVGLSKSGLFAHFASKQNLQLQVLETGAARFIETVVRPAVQEPRGEPRVRAMFENWILWSQASFLPGGCLFVAGAAELDDRPGPVRDYLMATQRDWTSAMARSAAIAVDVGHFRADLDCQQFAFELYSILLAYHLFRRLLGDPAAEQRGRSAFERLLADAH